MEDFGECCNFAAEIQRNSAEDNNYKTKKEMKKYKTTPEKLAVLKTRGNYYRNWEKYQDDYQFNAEEILIRICREWNHFLYSDGIERDLDEMMSNFAYHSRSELITDSRDFFEMMRELGKLNSYANLLRKIRAYLVSACEGSTWLSRDEEKEINELYEFVHYFTMGDFLKRANIDKMYKLSAKTGLGRYAQDILFDTSTHMALLDGMVREWVKKQTKAVKNAKVA